MRERRMISSQIIQSDAFLSLPLTAQALYVHLNLFADDDGFIGNPNRAQRMIGASAEDLALLYEKRFLLRFESGVAVIKHWFINNTIRTDRKKNTGYREELAQLKIKENGAYTLNQATKSQPTDNQAATICQPTDNQAATICQPTDTPNKVNLNKDNLKERERVRARGYETDTVDPGEINRLFVEFWNLYPRKENQDAACRAWISMVDSLELAQEIIAAVRENNAKNASWKRGGGRFVPKADNWLFDRRWRDEIREEKDTERKDPFQVEGSGFEYMNDPKWMEEHLKREREKSEKAMAEKLKERERAQNGRTDTNAADVG